MGTSTDAILVYGIPVAISEHVENSNDRDGLPEDHPKNLAFNGSAVDGISIVLHCCYEEPMAIVAIAETENIAYRGSPEQIKPLNLYFLTSHHNKKLRAYCEKYNLETSGNPGWWLVSWWG
jgi:hypothetical protein